MAYRDDSEIIANTHNIARFFTENRHISWALLIAVLIWGVFGWINMPKSKDPYVPVLVAVVLCPWPGADVEEIEQLVTTPIEQTIAHNQINLFICLSPQSFSFYILPSYNSKL